MYAHICMQTYVLIYTWLAPTVHVYVYDIMHTRTNIHMCARPPTRTHVSATYKYMFSNIHKALSVCMVSMYMYSLDLSLRADRLNTGWVYTG